MQSSSWSILNEPLLPPPPKKAARFTSPPALFGLSKQFSRTDPKEQILPLNGGDDPSQASVGLKRPVVGERFRLQTQGSIQLRSYLQMSSREPSGAAYFSGRPTTDKANNAGTRRDHSSPPHPPDQAADEEMRWNVRFQRSQCDSIKSKTSPSVAAATERSSASEAPLENVGIRLDVRITEPSGETRGSDGTRSLRTKLQENIQAAAPNCLNTWRCHGDDEDWEPLILPVCCSSDLGTQCLLLYFE